jgi:hypothetical protein
MARVAGLQQLLEAQQATNQAAAGEASQQRGKKESAEKS